MTTYHLERDDSAYPLGNAPIHEPDVTHRLLSACGRRLSRIQRACRRINGPRTWVPLRVYAIDAGDWNEPRPLTDDEAADLSHFTLES